MPELELIAIIFNFAGGVLIAFMALKVHERFLTERRIDRKVLREMKQEQVAGLVGVAFLTTGFLLNVISFFISHL